MLHAQESRYLGKKFKCLTPHSPSKIKAYSFHADYLSLIIWFYSLLLFHLVNRRKCRQNFEYKNWCEIFPTDWVASGMRHLRLFGFILMFQYRQLELWVWEAADVPPMAIRTLLLSFTNGRAGICNNRNRVLILEYQINFYVKIKAKQVTFLYYILCNQYYNIIALIFYVLALRYVK